MILFVIIGIIFLRYIYAQVVVPPDVQKIWDEAVKDYERSQRHPNMLVYDDAVEPDLDLMYNKVIDFDEAFKC